MSTARNKQRIDDLIFDHTDSLTDWEKKFLHSIRDYVNSGLSVKQEAVLNKIYDKVVTGENDAES